MPLFACPSNEERAARPILKTDAPIGSDTRCSPLLCAEPKSKRMCRCVRAALDVEFVSLSGFLSKKKKRLSSVQSSYTNPSRSHVTELYGN